MSFTPHTPADVEQMTAAIGIDSLSALFDEIPTELRVEAPPLPPALTEWHLKRLMMERADRLLSCFIGAGAYEHHIPAVIADLIGRGEFYSAYTPYQPEASQGTLQVIYEYQTMMASLMGLEVSNASLYDGASALAEAVLMAVRSRRHGVRILMPRTVHPFYRRTVHTIVQAQGIPLIELPFDPQGGHVPPKVLTDFVHPDNAALVIPQPNFFGILEDVDALTDWAHQQGLLVIAQVNPLSVALLKPPGEWGQQGADIACGEGQPLGIPLASGGPYFGFLCCKKALIRQLPGRLVARTVDKDGKTGFTLTLQAREQHIRRSKATSNICTNQGLMVTAATIYLCLMGPHGLVETARSCHLNTLHFVEQLKSLGVQPVFNRPIFHEAVMRIQRPVSEILAGLLARGILGGFDMTADYPELGQAFLLCVTETKTADDLAHYVAALKQLLA